MMSSYCYSKIYILSLSSLPTTKTSDDTTLGSLTYPDCLSAGYIRYRISVYIIPLPVHYVYLNLFRSPIVFFFFVHDIKTLILFTKKGRTIIEYDMSHEYETCI